MKIRKIGFGQTKNLGNYQNQKIFLESELEDWEDSSQSLDLLRERVAEELDLGDRWRGLRAKAIREGAALQVIENQIKFKQEKLDELERRCDGLTEFLKWHGVNPDTLAIEYYDEQKRLAHTTRTDLEEMTDLYLIASADDDDDDDDDDNDDDDDDEDEKNRWDEDDTRYVDDVIPRSLPSRQLYTISRSLHEVRSPFPHRILQEQKQ